MARTSHTRADNVIVRRVVNSILTASALVAVSAAVPVFAQTAPAAAKSSDASELQEIYVTGSRIARTDIETPSPVQVISAEELKASGFTTVSEVLRNITANGQGTLSNAFGLAFAGGATGISLRGLNTSATLVLIDGHRVAPFALSDDGQRSFVDISSVPFDAVEDIQILKDGASAAYGSDAMAGVVNIILKKKYVGTSFSGEAGTSTEGGGTTEHVTFMHGMGDLDADGYNAYVNLEYRNSDHILYSQRTGDGAWASLNQTNIGGIDQTPGTPNNPFVSHPATYGTNYITPFGTPTTGVTAPYFYATPIQPNAAYKGTCTAALQAADGCTFINPHSEVQPGTKNMNALLAFKKKLGDDWMLDLKASLFNSQGEQVQPGSTANGLITYPSSFSGNIGASAYSLPHLVGTTIPAITIPVNYPGNPFGVPAIVRGVNLDAPYSRTVIDNNTYRIAADLTGTVAGWTTDVAFGWSQEETKQDIYGDTDRPVLQALLNSTTNPWIITGGNSAANIAAVFPVPNATDTSTLWYGEVDINRPLTTLAGGPLGLDLGAQYVTRMMNSPAPELIADGILAGNNAWVLGSQTDTAVFAELDAPVTTMLELDGQVRFDHFNISGDATTPTIKFKFKPIKQFALRGTFGEGFRAPNPAENGNAGQAYSAGTASDPILCPNGPTAAGAVISQCNYNLIFQNSANKALKPEKSKSETIGIVFEPISAWSSTVDFYQVKIDNQIVAGAPNFAGTVRGSPVTDTCSDGKGGTYQCTTSVGEIVYVPVSYANLNSTKVNGIEIESKYKLDIGAVGTLTFDADWSHTMSYQYSIQGQTFQLAGTHGPGVIGGNTGNPKDRVQASITWDSGPWQVRTAFNYIGSFDLTDPSGSNFGGPSSGVQVFNCADGVADGGTFLPWFLSGTPTNGKYCKVQQFLDTDLYASYKIGEHWAVHASMLNVFNSQPPLDLNTYGGGNLPYNPSMHQAGAVGRFINVGFSAAF